MGHFQQQHPAISLSFFCWAHYHLRRSCVRLGTMYYYFLWKTERAGRLPPAAAVYIINCSVYISVSHTVCACVSMFTNVLHFLLLLFLNLLLLVDFVCVCTSLFFIFIFPSLLFRCCCCFPPSSYYWCLLSPLSEIVWLVCLFLVATARDRNWACRRPHVTQRLPKTDRSSAACGINTSWTSNWTLIAHRRPSRRPTSAPTRPGSSGGSTVKR